MTSLWAEPVRELVRQTGNDMPGLWSLLMTACMATSKLSLLAPLDDDLSLTDAVSDLHEAAGELEWVHPHLPVTGVVLHVGPAPLDDVAGCRAAIASLIVKSLQVMAHLLDDPATSTGEVMSLTRVMTLLSSARAHVVGRPS